LHVAVQRGDEVMVQLLLKQGAKVNVLDSGGCTPLNVAVRCRQDGIVQTLFNHGARNELGRPISPNTFASIEASYSNSRRMV